MDTRSKRASSVNLLKPYALALVLPDGALNEGDRHHSVWDYSGISSATVPATIFLEGIIYGPGLGGTIRGPGLEGTVKM